jgi:hypothetical protein
MYYYLSILQLLIEMVGRQFSHSAAAAKKKGVFPQGKYTLEAVNSSVL